MCSYKVSQGNIFGRIGTGIGQGIAESLPREMERGRLAQGLQQFEQEHANLTPIQQLARLSAIPGITPQMIQSFGELAKQTAKGKALADLHARETTPKPSPFPTIKETKPSPGSNIPSLTTEETFRKTQEGYIPPTRKEIMDYAGILYNKNPALYDNDPNKAILEAEKSAAQEQLIQEAYKTKHENLTNIQDNVVKRLQNQSAKLGVAIPSNIYSKIEDKAIQATKPKDQGGDGLTEQQAMKLYGDELDAVSRDYKAVDTVGDWGITAKKASESLRSFKNLQKKFEKRGDTENLALTMIDKNGLSPELSYALAEPVSSVPQLNNEIARLPQIQSKISFKKGYAEIPVPKAYTEEETLKVAKKLAPIFSKNEQASPLAVAYELEKKGYDGSTFLGYLTDNKEDLHLYPKQERQLDIPRNLFPRLNDWWLSEWTGLGK